MNQSSYPQQWQAPSPPVENPLLPDLLPPGKFIADVVLLAGTYPAVLKKVTREWHRPTEKRPQPYEQIVFFFDVSVTTDGKGVALTADGTEVHTVEKRYWAPVPNTLSELSKLVQIGKALGFVSEERVLVRDTAEWVGARCRVVLTEKIDPETNEVVDNYIDKVLGAAMLPVRHPARPTAPSPALAAPIPEPPPASRVTRRPQSQAQPVAMGAAEAVVSDPWGDEAQG